MARKYFEQFEVGHTFVHEIRRTVTDMDNILFSALTHNPAAIPINHEYAKTAEFRRPLINSIFRAIGSRRSPAGALSRTGKASRLER